MNANDLIKEHIKLNDQLKEAAKWFATQCVPKKQRMQEIEAALLDMLNTQKADSFKCEDGTCYKSHILNVKVEDREKLLDFINERWDEIGNELLLLNAQKDAVKRWTEETGAPPPGVVTSYFTHLNVRRA